MTIHISWQVFLDSIEGSVHSDGATKYAASTEAWEAPHEHWHDFWSLAPHPPGRLPLKGAVYCNSDKLVIGPGYE